MASPSARKAPRPWAPPLWTRLGLSGQTIACGGDMRPSLARLQPRLRGRRRSAWANVEDLGRISTDELYYACGSLDMAGAIFTASHNPAEYNGIKMAKAGAVPVSAETGLTAIRDLAQQYLDGGIPAGKAEGTVTTLDVLAAYAEKLRSLVPLDAVRPLKVVVDAGNGMAGLTVPAVLGDQLHPASAAHCCAAVLRARRDLPEPSCQPARAGEPPRPAGCRRRPRGGPGTGVRRRR